MDVNGIIYDDDRLIMSLIYFRIIFSFREVNEFIVVDEDLSWKTTELNPYH